MPGLSLIGERRKDVFTGVVTKQADMQPGLIDKGKVDGNHNKIGI